MLHNYYNNCLTLILTIDHDRRTYNVVLAILDGNRDDSRLRKSQQGELLPCTYSIIFDTIKNCQDSCIRRSRSDEMACRRWADT